jgi:hypothetical protein
MSKVETNDEIDSEDDDDDDTDYTESDDGSHYDRSGEDNYEKEEYALRGLRLFMNRIEGEENDPADFSFEEDVSPPTVDYIIEKLVQKEGIIQDLVKSLIVHHDDYMENYTYTIISHDLWGKLNGIISDYKKSEIALLS